MERDALCKGQGCCYSTDVVAGRRRVCPPNDLCYFCDPSQTVTLSSVVRALSSFYVLDLGVYKNALAIASKQFGEKLRPAVSRYLKRSMPGRIFSVRASLTACAISNLLGDLHMFPGWEQRLKEDGQALLAARMLCRDVVFLHVASYLVRGPSTDLERTKRMSYTLSRHPAMKPDIECAVENVSAQSYARAMELHRKGLVRLRRLLEHVLHLARPLRLADLERAWDTIGRIFNEPQLVRFSFCHENFHPLCCP